MASWVLYAILAAALYGAHQVFTRMASDHIGDGVGGLVVEGTATLTILIYLAILYFSGNWEQKFSMQGFKFSVLTGICVGMGTVAFFLLFQRGGPLSAVPAILAIGAAIMAVAGVLLFDETLTWQRALGVVLSIAGLMLLRS